MNKIFLSLVFIILSCTNPFDTRDPKPPQTISPIQPISNLQNDPDSLLKQMQLAFQELEWNYYDALLVDPAKSGINFVFIPQQDAVYTYGLQNWTRQDELNYFKNLIHNRKRNDLILQIYNVQGPVQIGASQDTMQTQFSYQIEIYQENRKEYYNGQGIFKMLRSQQSLWYIFYWEDLKASKERADSTWSVVKASYRY